MVGEFVANGWMTISQDVFHRLNGVFAPADRSDDFDPPLIEI